MDAEARQAGRTRARHRPAHRNQKRGSHAGRARSPTGTSGSPVLRDMPLRQF